MPSSRPYHLFFFVFLFFFVPLVGSRCAGGLRLVQEFLGMPRGLAKAEAALSPALCDQKRGELLLYKLLNQADSPAARMKVRGALRRGAARRVHAVGVLMGRGGPRVIGPWLLRGYLRMKPTTKASAAWLFIVSWKWWGVGLRLGVVVLLLAVWWNRASGGVGWGLCWAGLGWAGLGCGVLWCGVVCCTCMVLWMRWRFCRSADAFC